MASLCLNVCALGPTAAAMNDVDSLLAELDDVLDDKKPSAPAKGSRYTKENNFQQPPPQRRISGDSGGGDDIDALLADLGGGEPSPPARQPVSMGVKPSAPVPSPGALAFPGSSSGGGSSGSGQRNATGMRCTKCDFKVLRFLDSAWSSDADYMFFRNFMPNVAKLEAKLVPSDGSCAYACQCSWSSAELGEPHNVSNWFMAR